MAKSDLVLPNQYAILFDPGAVLVLGTAAFTAVFQVLLRQQPFLPGQVMPASPAVETAGAYQ
jgi:hypothetical protein